MEKAEKKPILRLENIGKIYHDNGNVSVGIRKVNASFNMGEFVIITGASGSGKSTLLNVLSGMTTYEEGTMYINGEDTGYFGPKDYEEYRRKYVSYIFQNYNIIDSYSVYENIALALTARGMEKEKIKPIVMDIIKKVGLENRVKNRVSKLSGGEKQRVAIARALVSDAPILVCDEITGNLDHKTGVEIISLLRSLSKEKLVLMVTHDPDEVMKYATRIVKINDGSIIEDKTLVQYNEVENVKLKQSEEIKSKDMFNLALKNLHNTPKRSFFITLILLLSVILIGFSVATASSASNTNLGYNWNSSSLRTFPERVLVKKNDSSVITTDDIDKFNALDGIKKIYQNDTILDYSISGSTYDNASDWDEDNYSMYGYIDSISSIESKDISIGEIADQDNEIVIKTAPGSAYDIIKNNVGQNIMMEFGDLEGTFKINGFILDDLVEKDVIYFSDNIINNCIDLFSIQQNINYSLKLTANNDTSQYTDISLFLINNSLSDDSIDLIFNNAKYDWDELEGDDPSDYTYTNPDNIVLTNYYLDNPMTFSTNSVTFTEDTDSLNFSAYGFSSDIFKYDYNRIGGAIGIVNQDTYDTLIPKSNTQVSIIASSAKSAKNIAEELSSNGYVAIVAYEEEANSFNLENVLVSTLIYLFSILLMFFIYLIASLSLKNIIYSQKHDFLVMRSLGINIKEVKKQIYYEIFFIGSILLIVFTTAVIVLHQFYFSSSNFLKTFSEMTTLDVFFTWILILCLMFFLARKFSKNIFMSNIASKEK